MKSSDNASEGQLRSVESTRECKNVSLYKRLRVMYCAQTKLYIIQTWKFKQVQTHAKMYVYIINVQYLMLLRNTRIWHHIQEKLPVAQKKYSKNIVKSNFTDSHFLLLRLVYTDIEDIVINFPSAGTASLTFTDQWSIYWVFIQFIFVMWNFLVIYPLNIAKNA